MGAGQISMAIARRVGFGMKIILGDRNKENADAIAKIMNGAGFDVEPLEADLSSRESIRKMIAEGQKYGAITKMVNGAGVSPSQAPVEAILKVDLYGTAVLLEEVGKVIAEGGSGVTISSQSGFRMPALTAEQDALLATGPYRRIAEARNAKARKYPRHAPRLSACETLQRKARYGGVGQVGRTRSAAELYRSRNYRNTACY